MSQSDAPLILVTGRNGQVSWELRRTLQPLGRVGEIDDVVDAVLYLADADFVTGVVLPVDGGVSAGS